MKEYPFYLANEPTRSAEAWPVSNKFSGEVFARVCRTGPEDLQRAIASGAAAAPTMAAMKPYERRAILDHCVTALRKRGDELADLLCVEVGKPIRDARGEVARLIDTFRVAAEESVRFNGEVMNLEISDRASGYSGMWKRVPIGLCSFITPFNFPLNLAAHKVAPAIAVGCPFVLKPSRLAPVSALVLGEVLAGSELPAGAFSILPVDHSDAGPLSTDERIRLLSFTGSREVGFKLKGQAGMKRVTLELGGNAACIVDAEADIEDAVERLVVGSFSQSGQSCISVQRVLAHDTVYEALLERFVERTRELVVGDPRREDTFVGPVISEDEAARIIEWIEEAEAGGARVLTGGQRQGVLVEPTIMADVPRTSRLYREEVFGPVVGLGRFHDFEEALDEVNDSRYGLQAGVFTHDIRKVRMAWSRLQVGGVVINDVPSFRVDNMPYGGVKDSGHGREGVRFAMEEMSEIRLLVVREG